MNNILAKRAKDISYQINMYLRVLLAKWPDIWEPIFWGQCIYGCIIKSNYLGDVPKAKSWDLRAHTGLWGAIQVLGLK